MIRCRVEMSSITRRLEDDCVVDNLDETSPYHHGYRKSLNAHGGDTSNGATSRQTSLVVVLCQTHE